MTEKKAKKIIKLYKEFKKMDLDFSRLNEEDRRYQLSEDVVIDQVATKLMLPFDSVNGVITNYYLFGK